MLTEIIYLIIGLIGMILMLNLARKKAADSPQNSGNGSKQIILSVVTLLATAFLMLISSTYIPALANITGNSQESAQIFFGCLGAVVLPLIMGFVSILIMKKIINNKSDNKFDNETNKKGLLISVIIAVICAVSASVLESIDIKETMAFINQIDFSNMNMMSLMEMSSFKPRFEMLVRILTLLPTVAAVIMNSCSSGNVDHTITTRP